jgi:hypothetical protein
MGEYTLLDRQSLCQQRSLAYSNLPAKRAGSRNGSPLIAVNDDTGGKVHSRTCAKREWMPTSGPPAAEALLAGYLAAIRTVVTP